MSSAIFLYHVLSLNTHINALIHPAVMIGLNVAVKIVTNGRKSIAIPYLSGRSIAAGAKFNGIQCILSHFFSFPPKWYSSFLGVPHAPLTLCSLKMRLANITRVVAIILF